MDRNPRRGAKKTVANQNPWRIHETGIFTYIYQKNQLNVGKYTSLMDGMGPKNWKDSRNQRNAKKHRF